MPPRDAPCRHLHQDRGACMDCGRVWGEPKQKPLSRAEEHREELAFLVWLLRDQDARTREMWHVTRRIVVTLTAELVVRQVAVRVLNRVMEQVVAFDARCEAGDVEGAVLALRVWLRKLLPQADPPTKSGPRVVDSAPENQRGGAPTPAKKKGTAAPARTA